MHTSLKIVALTFESFIIELNNLDIDTSWSNIDELVRSVLVLDDVTVGRALLHPDKQAVHAASQGIALTEVASARLNLSRARTLITLLLELLHHAWADLLASDNGALALTVWTCGYIVFIVCSTASAMRANNVAVVLQFKISTCVQLCQRNRDFQTYTWSCLFRPINKVKKS